MMVECKKERVCGDCIHRAACENMVRVCNPGRGIVGFETMPVGSCRHFFSCTTNTSKDREAEIANLKMTLDEWRAKYAALHSEYEKTREEREQISEKFKHLSRENDLLRAQLDIVHLIFGKG